MSKSAGGAGGGGARAGASAADGGAGGDAAVAATTVLGKLKALYERSILPLESTYHFGEFASPLLKARSATLCRRGTQVGVDGGYCRGDANDWFSAAARVDIAAACVVIVANMFDDGHIFCVDGARAARSI